MPGTPAVAVRDEVVERARRRLASGFYDSAVCLDITVRRINRELRRPTIVVVAKRPTKLPGRAAQKGLRPAASKMRRRG